jgi:hypothetical protein
MIDVIRTGLIVLSLEALTYVVQDDQRTVDTTNSVILQSWLHRAHTWIVYLGGGRHDAVSAAVGAVDSADVTRVVR